ncbi:MAG: hypothetical protein IIA66_07035 [Planctomycetes bacterium]|nr:hypothetical protein [Planctomycetota bacterium]
MACLSDEQIEALAVNPDDRSRTDLWNHLERCPKCRMRVKQVLAGTDLVRDIQELRQRRESLKPLLEGMDMQGRAAGPAPDNPV